MAHSRRDPIQRVFFSAREAEDFASYIQNHGGSARASGKTVMVSNASADLLHRAFMYSDRVPDTPTEFARMYGRKLPPTERTPSGLTPRQVQTYLRRQLVAGGGLLEEEGSAPLRRKSKSKSKRIARRDPPGTPRKIASDVRVRYKGLIVDIQAADLREAIASVENEPKNSRKRALLSVVRALDSVVAAIRAGQPLSSKQRAETANDVALWYANEILQGRGEAHVVGARVLNDAAAPRKRTPQRRRR